MPCSDNNTAWTLYTSKLTKDSLRSRIMHHATVKTTQEWHVNTGYITIVIQYPPHQLLKAKQLVVADDAQTGKTH